LRHQLDDRDARHELSDSNWSSPGYPFENFAIQLTVGPPALMSGIGQAIETSVGPLTLQTCHWITNPNSPTAIHYTFEAW